MKVKDLPHPLYSVCIDRGLIEDAEVSPRQACMEWAGWWIGDPSWAASIIDLYNEATNLQRKENEAK